MVTIPLCYSNIQQKGRPLWAVQINVVLPPSHQTVLNWTIGDFKPPSNCLPPLFRLNNVSFTNVSFQSFLCGVLILPLWPLSCLYFQYNRKKLCCLGGLTLQLLSPSLVYSKTECVKEIPVKNRVRGKKEGKFQVLNMLKLGLCWLVFTFEPKWEVSAAQKTPKLMV